MGASASEAGATCPAGIQAVTHSSFCTVCLWEPCHATFHSPASLLQPHAKPKSSAGRDACRFMALSCAALPNGLWCTKMLWQITHFQITACRVLLLVMRCTWCVGWIGWAEAGWLKVAGFAERAALGQMSCAKIDVLRHTGCECKRCQTSETSRPGRCGGRWPQPRLLQRTLTAMCQTLDTIQS